jgi:hypothetical protein
VRYRFEQSVRRFSILVLIVVIGLWAGLIGRGLLRGEPLTFGTTAASLIAAIIAVAMTWLVLRGGVWRLEIDESGIAWSDPSEGFQALRFADLEGFRIIHSPGGGGASADAAPSSDTIELVRRGGERLRVPRGCVGDEQRVHRLLGESLRRLDAPAGG